MPVDIPEWTNLARWCLEDRLEEGAGDRIALRVPEAELTYSEIDEQASRGAHLLRELGVRREERVFVALPDGPEFVAALFGILKLGAVVVMVNPELGAEQITALLDYCEPRLATVAAGRLEAWEEAARAARNQPRFVVVGPDTGGHPRWDGLVEQAPAGFTAVETHRDDAAIWLFSGGTTGRPKAVVQTHRSYVNTTVLYAHRTVGYRPDDVTLSVPRLYFGYATGCNLLFPFSVGASAVLSPEHPTPELIFEQIRAFRPTILVNVPSMIRRMVEHPAATEQDLSSLRFSTSAGEALPVPLHERWCDTFGVDLLDGLGTAEMWHIFVTNRPGEIRPGTLGRVVEGFEIRVCDEDGRELPDGETGRLWVRGGSRAIAYWRNLERTAECFRGEWFVGGDLVRRDADGYVTYCGRADDVLKVKGKWLSPQEVESCLMRHPAVAECAVVGVEDEAGLTLPWAFVVADGRHEGLERRLQEHVLAHLQPYKHPRRVVRVDSLPRTHLGKIDRSRLKEMAREE